MTAAQAAAAACGGVLLVVALADVFVTIFAYDGFTLVTPRLRRLLWSGFRATSARLPDRARHAFLSLGSAAMLPATLAFWLGLETAAFGLIFVPGVAGHGFVVSPQAGHGPGAAFYLSGGALTSLTFGDLVPRAAFDRAMMDLETVIGLATFTLGLTYVLSAFGALTKLNDMYARVRRNAIEPNRPATIIERRYRSGDPSYLVSFLESMVEQLEGYAEALRRYPVAFYFHTRRLQRSTPHIFQALGELIQLIRWGLPADETLTTNPTLLALIDTYSSTRDRLLRSFVGQEWEPADSPSRDRAGDEAAYTRLQHEARAAAGLTRAGTTDPPGRFDEWLAFHLRQRVFIDLMRRALGY